MTASEFLDKPVLLIWSYSNDGFDLQAPEITTSVEHDDEWLKGLPQLYEKTMALELLASFSTEAGAHHDIVRCLARKLIGIQRSLPY
ncbi:hypothetical protein F2Q68_00010482 [Brassica cretica]|uniref:Uncharacterized protein n=1 Tax=Brassica cretica TaxID=69181 RepID=A0A8S9KT09_BRACR|nr:hypothetical protein F2Q68_00010482 [Brassica cretica]